MESLENRLNQIRLDMSKANALWAHQTKLIAVTKTHSASQINTLVALEQFDIGENRVQEITDKISDLDAKFQIHLIGRLQSNKVKYIIDNVCQIQSVDRMSLAQEIDRQAQRIQRRMPILIQVSPADEPQKGGIQKERLVPFLKEVAKLEGIQVNGLMAVMPLSTDEVYLSSLFENMRNLFERVRQEAISHIAMNELSMGMSNDYRLALAKGATTIRVGTALFGSRR